MLELGWSYKLGDRFTLEAAAQRLGIVPSQRRLFNRLLQILAEVNVLEAIRPQWQVQAPLEMLKATSKHQTCSPQVPQNCPELTLLHRCSAQLSGVLRGAVDPVQLLFPAGDFTTATQLYQDTPTAQVLNTLIQKVITQTSQTLPRQRGFRLLEIGAGTGSTTSYILPQLEPSQADYVFTDIGPLFTTKAQEKFQDYPFVRYQTLDIEADPVAQGFESHQYDLIVAANVLHATANLTQTLTHVRQLLAQGGILVLLEVTTPQRWLDLIFGLLEGWWKFSDLELRPDYPLLSCSQWQQLLSDVGFSQVVTLPDRDGLSDRLSHQSVIVAQAEPTAVEQSATEAQGWLILADRQGVGEQLATQVRSNGAVCFLVQMGDRYKQISPTEFTLNPNQPKDFEQLLAAIAIHPLTFSEVVQCWTLDAKLSQDGSPEDLERLSQLSCGTTLFIVQAIVKQGLSPAPRLWLVTQGAQPAPNGEAIALEIAQSPVWGLAKVIQLEHPELNCACVDLDPQVPLDHQAFALWSEIWSQNPEDQVALRADARYVARLQRQDSAQSNPNLPLCFREDSTYLITGGLGGLGLLMADWMVEKGARHLVLLARRAPHDEAQNRLTSLEQAGAQVVVEIADVSDRDAMEQVFARLSQSAYPLAGIMHAAGLLSDGVLQNQSWSSFAKVMAPKVQGAWHLHHLSQHQPLDFFVVFSSAASLLGSSGQSNHAAANAFLDGLAHYRQTMGLPGLSIQLGTVSQIGEAAERGADVRFKQRGINALRPAQFLEALEQLMKTSETTIGVVSIDWSGLQTRIAEWPFLVNWQPKTSDNVSKSKAKILQQLEAAVPSERKKLLITHVLHQVALVLGISDVQSISLKAGFYDLGMDSLTSVELRNRLQTSLDCAISTTLAFDYPTVEDLVDYLVQQILKIDTLEQSKVGLKLTEVQEVIAHESEDVLDDEDVETSLINTLEILGY